MGQRTSTGERFWSKVDRSGECWLWRAKLQNRGYGQFSFNGHAVLAHRFAYELLIGPIPDGLTLDHLCRAPACVNPLHLEPVTHLENVRRGNAVGPRPNARNANAAKTHCPAGHPYDVTNTYRNAKGDRICRACNRERANRHYYANR